MVWRQGAYRTRVRSHPGGLGGRLDSGSASPAPEAQKGGVTTPGLTFDTGMLIALERRSQRAWHVYREARNRKVPITVPTAVIAEWWRGHSDAREHVRSGLRVESLTEPLARIVGEALARVQDATVVDAVVMASAASRGDVVYTSDFVDLENLRSFFPGVRVLSI
jgi:hypothetical protein